uniref:SH2 domain-containing protein n=1 Tax=Elaeophora elaphi TaxID=1147741 RepID=A0A0R3RWQ4_9BILA
MFLAAVAIASSKASDEQEKTEEPERRNEEITLTRKRSPLKTGFNSQYDALLNIIDVTKSAKFNIMMRTIPLRLPATPPPPPPPPPLEIQIKPKNGSSSGGTKWTLRTEARDGGDKNSMTLRAEGIIEIPKPQSVASLREQIAKKLEVKMPSIPPPSSVGSMTVTNGHKRSPLWTSDLNGQYPYVQHDDTSSFQHLAPKMSKPIGNSQSSNHTTPQKQLSIVHEPVERHISCITPIPFNRTATLSSSVIITPNTLNICSNNISVAPTSSSSSPAIFHKHEENNDYTCSPAYDMAGSSQLNDYQKLKPVSERVDGRLQSSLPSTTSSIANGTISVHYSITGKNTTTALPTLNSPSFSINGHSTNRNEITIKDSELSASTTCDGIVPDSNLRTDNTQEVGNQIAASSSPVVTTSTSPCETMPLSKPVELMTKIQPESGCVQSEHQNIAANATLKTYNNHHSAPERELRGTIPCHDAHTENSSWYRAMFKKMHVVDQLGLRGTITIYVYHSFNLLSELSVHVCK